MKNLTLGLALVGTLFSGAALAEPSAYVIGGFGQASFDIDSESESDTSFIFGGGYSFSQNFAVEARYNDFGEIEASVNTGGGTVSGGFSASAFTFDVVASVPLADTFSAYAKLGVSFWDIDAYYEETGFADSLSVEGSSSGSDLNFGFGAELSASDALKIGAEYTMFTAEDDGLELDINNLAFFAKFHF